MNFNESFALYGGVTMAQVETGVEITTFGFPWIHGSYVLRLFA